MSRRWRNRSGEKTVNRYSPGEHSGHCRGYPEPRVRRNPNTRIYVAVLACSCGAFARIGVNGHEVFAAALSDAIDMERIYMAKLAR